MNLKKCDVTSYMILSIEKQNEIRALIQLLGDDDPEINTIAYQKLSDLEGDGLFLLYEAADRDDDPTIRIRLRRLLEKSRLKRLEMELKSHVLQWGDYLDLEEGVFLIGKIEYPLLNQRTYRIQLDNFAEKIRPRIAKQNSINFILRQINQVLFQQEKFRGDIENYYNPQNNHMHCVLERHLGIPISLSIIYLLVAKRLNLPIYGINAPSHFLCKYKTSDEEKFIDPFNQGALLSFDDYMMFLLRNGFDFHQNYLELTPPRLILARVLRNLMVIYQQTQHYQKYRIIRRFYDILIPFGEQLQKDESFYLDD